MERPHGSTKEESVSSLTDSDRVYIVLRRDGKIFSRNKSFENIRDRLTFLQALLDPMNQADLTEYQWKKLVVSAYLGNHPRCNELRVPGCEDAVSTAETDDGPISPTVCVKKSCHAVVHGPRD